MNVRYFMRRCKEVGGVCTRNRRVVVLSGGQWLDSLHGTSVLSLFRSLASHSYRVEILSDSHTPRRLGNARAHVGLTVTEERRQIQDV